MIFSEHGFAELCRLDFEHQIEALAAQKQPTLAQHASEAKNRSKDMVEAHLKKAHSAARINTKASAKVLS